jgi:hypothetical protein
MHKICENCRKPVKKVGKVYRVWFKFDMWMCKKCREKNINTKSIKHTY